MRKVTVEKPFNLGTMTHSMFFSKIRSGLRNTFRYWKPMQEALKLASRPSESENKRLKTEYKCAHCDKWFKRADVQIDHIVECGSLKDWDDIVPFLRRLTIEDVRGYQILCKKCHNTKTLKYKEEKKNE